MKTKQKKTGEPDEQELEKARMCMEKSTRCTPIIRGLCHPKHAEYVYKAMTGNDLTPEEFQKRLIKYDDGTFAFRL